MKGSLQLQNRGLRSLEEAWMATFGISIFLLSLVFFCASLGA